VDAVDQRDLFHREYKVLRGQFVGLRSQWSSMFTISRVTICEWSGTCFIASIRFCEDSSWVCVVSGLVCLLYQESLYVSGLV
jgi:hypothetical protein